MSVTCPCPDPNAGVEAINISNCGQGGNQINKIGFQNAAADFFTDENDSVDPATNITSQSAWLAQISTDDVQVTPTFVNGVLTAGDFITRSGGNDTKEGATKIDGINSSDLTGDYENLAQADFDSLIVYNCKADSVEIFLFEKTGIWCAKKNASNFYNGLDPNTIGLKSREMTGFGAADLNNFLISLPGDWQTGATFIETDWDPTALLN